MSTHTPVVLVVLLTVGLLLFPKATAAGDSFEWTGASDANTWTDPCNWRPRGDCPGDAKYPGEEGDDDSATIVFRSGITTHPVLSDHITLAALTIGPEVTLTGGSIEVSRQFAWSGGVIYSNIRVLSSASLAITGPAIKQLGADFGGGRITNLGRATWSGSGTIQLHSRAVFENRGIFVAQNNAVFLGGACCETVNTFRNEGTFIKLGGAGMTTFESMAFVNSGDVRVETGVLQLAFGKHAVINRGRFGGRGLTRVEGSLSLDGDVVLARDARFELTGDGSMRGQGAFNGPGTFHWTGGTISALVVIDNQTTMRIHGDDRKVLLRGSMAGPGRLHTEGTTIWSDSGPISLQSGAVIVNSGTLRIESAAPLSGGSTVTPGRFDNEGTLVKARSSGTTVFENVRVRNYGNVLLRGGTLSLTGSGSGFMQPKNTLDPDAPKALTVLDDADLSSERVLRIEDGSLAGTGTITGDVHNNAVLEPGLSTGGIAIVGAYRQGPEGTLVIEVAGRIAADGYDQLNVQGRATLHGTLVLRLAGGFQPRPEDAFRIVGYERRTGRFRLVVGPPGNGIRYSPGSIILAFR